MKYSITIYRYNDGDTEEIIDTYITADQAIDALLYVQGLAPEVSEIEIIENRKEDEMIVEYEEPASTPRKAAGKRASRTDYDKEALTVEVKAGKVTNAELSEKYGVSLATIYQIKHKLKHADPLAVADEAPPATAYAVRQKERAAVPGPDTNIPGEIKMAFLQGFSLSEVSDMYPMIPLEEITRIKNDKN